MNLDLDTLKKIGYCLLITANMVLIGFSTFKGLVPEVKIEVKIDKVMCEKCDCHTRPHGTGSIGQEQP